MNFDNQNNFAIELEKFLVKWLNNSAFHVVVSVEGIKGSGFTFSISSLSGSSEFDSCNVVVSGVVDEVNSLTKTFQIPSDKSIKKPVEPK